MDTGPLTTENALARFEEASRADLPKPSFQGRGILITAGGPFVPSAYVGVRLLRQFGVTLPVEIWHAGEDEIPPWGRKAFESCGATLHDVMPFYPDRAVKELRGWPIKPAALLASSLNEVLFLDADCFPLRNLEFLWQSSHFAENGALFWPDNRHHKMIAGASIWPLTGLDFRDDTEFETGIFLMNKTACWRELSLAQWMNANSPFWYQHVMGDKDTFYLAWRKLRRSYFLGPPCRRYKAVLTRHFWTDGRPLVDHRTGTSKYALPKRRGPFTVHLAPFQYRPSIKNVYDELMQRFLMQGFRGHVGYLDELDGFRQRYA
jgi:hypothetical protein